MRIAFSRVPSMANMLFTRLLSLTLYLAIICGGIEGKWVISKEEDMEIERQLKILNKPPVRTIQMQDGDIFHCIEIYKQPALDHPSLKNHKIQIRPSSLPDGMINELSLTEMNSNFGYNDTCPMGTVLIRRTRKEDLINAQHLQNSIKKYGPSSSTLDSASGSPHWAVVKTKIGIKYYGAKASLIIYGFPNIKYDQGTSGEIWIVGGQEGPREQLNAVHAGWHVNPIDYADTHTRLFTYWTVDGYNNTGCLNMRCPGFVQISSAFCPGTELKPVSIYNGIQHAITLLVFKDQKTGNWWLYLEHGKFKDFLGYWPKELFNKLDSASEIEWGGYTYSPFNEPSPPMGSGHFPFEGPNKTCYFKQVEVVDENNMLRKLPPYYVWTYSDIPKYYDIADYHNAGGTDGYMFAYGGPGGYKK